MAEAKKKATKKTKEVEVKEAELIAEAAPATTEAPAEEAKESKEDKPARPVDQTGGATAKAGKRSTKGIKEAEEKQAKVERQHHAAEEKAEAEAKPKQPVKPARSRLERRGKNYRKVAEQIEKGKTYKLSEALELAAKTNPAKFDATVELHIRLGVDPRQADQNIRGTLVMPAGTGKSVRVAVFADVDDVAKAKTAGADVAASDEFLQQLDKGTIDFDVLVATPAMMPKLGKYARLLGPKGLMPNPKSGTVTTDVAKAVKEAKAGRVEFRVDSTGIVHVGIGKVSFGASKLAENASALLTSIKQSKPASIKGAYVKSIYLTTTMGPSIPVEATA